MPRLFFPFFLFIVFISGSQTSLKGAHHNLPCDKQRKFSIPEAYRARQKNQLSFFI